MVAVAPRLVSVSAVAVVKVMVWLPPASGFSDGSLAMELSTNNVYTVLFFSGVVGVKLYVRLSLLINAVVAVLLPSDNLMAVAVMAAMPLLSANVTEIAALVAIPVALLAGVELTKVGAIGSGPVMVNDLSANARGGLTEGLIPSSVIADVKRRV